jgi:hypothetical protein
MGRSARAIGVLVAAMIAAAATPAAAEVLDAVYRGTLVCEKLPFTRTQMREAIDVTVSGGAARYVHVVRLRDKAAEPVPEQGAGTISGQNIELRGAWKDGTRQYEANYSGTFVRRSAQLKGTQTWTESGKTMTRACSGAIKRPLKPFLPRSKSKPAGA